MSPDMTNGNKRNVIGKRKRLCEVDTDQKGTDQSGICRYTDCREIGQCDACLG